MTLNETINIIGKIKVDIIGNIITNKSNVNILFKKIFNDNDDNIIKTYGDSKNTTKEEIDKSDIKDNEKQSSE